MSFIEDFSGISQQDITNSCCSGFNTTSPVEAFYSSLGSLQLHSLLERILGKSVEQPDTVKAGIFNFSCMERAASISKTEIIAMIKVYLHVLSV